MPFVQIKLRQTPETGTKTTRGPSPVFSEPPSIVDKDSIHGEATFLRRAKKGAIVFSWAICHHLRLRTGRPRTGCLSRPAHQANANSKKLRDRRPVEFSIYSKFISVMQINLLPFGNFMTINPHPSNWISGLSLFKERFCLLNHGQEIKRLFGPRKEPPRSFPRQEIYSRDGHSFRQH